MPTPLPEIHTSDRILFKRCRRKWSFQSPLRLWLEPIDQDSEALWYGTGFHYALEDYHGYNVYGTPELAFLAYAAATRNQWPGTIDRIVELAQLSQSMLSYYRLYWLPRRDIYQTLWIDGVPQVEVSWSFKIPGRRALAVGKFDRVVIDPYKRIWIEDYKTANKIDANKLETDPQVTSYALAGSQLYGRDIEGILYSQFLKEIPRRPNILKNGTFSKDKSQHVTYDTYTSALMEHFGHVPDDYQEFIGFLAASETESADRFIRRDTVSRSKESQQAELDKIILETKDMTAKTTPLYPNPTRDCAWDCNFRTACIATDDGADIQPLIENEYRTRKELDEWRHLLPTTGELPLALRRHQLDAL